MTDKREIQPTTERHLAQAYATVVQIFTAQAWPDGSWQAAYLDDLYRLHFDHPHVRVRADCLSLQEQLGQEVFRLAGGVEALALHKRLGRYDDAKVDPTQDAIFLHHIDEGAERADHGGWLPSEMLTIACAALGRRGSELRAWAVERSRQLYREGFYADPFSNTPRRRPAA